METTGKKQGYGADRSYRSIVPNEEDTSWTLPSPDTAFTSKDRDMKQNESHGIISTHGTRQQLHSELSLLMIR